LRYRDDKNIKDNDHFLNLIKLKKVIGLTSIFNLLELCGILSFNLSPESLFHLYWGFKNKYQLKQILFGKTFDENLAIDINIIFGYLIKKMSFGDAVVAACIEYHKDQIEGFVSWNVKHFEDKLNINLYTPHTLIKKLNINLT
jgi:hypothetical protein